MPIRYTLEQVTSIFEENKCILLDTEYSNQLGLLNYVASCGHSNIVSLKMFLNGNGRKCKSCALEIPSYQTISKAFLDKGCKLSLTEEEFIQVYKNNRSKLNYTASCGHQNTVCYANFNSLNQGINCPSCVNKNTGSKLKLLRSGENKNSSIEQEYNCTQYFMEQTKHIFDVKKTYDGCRADLCLKPFICETNEWLGIQVKTTSSERDKFTRYSFKFNKATYDKFLMVCICIKDKKMWLIPYEEVKDITSIGISSKSKYNQYEVTVEILQAKLLHFYETMYKFDFDSLNIPTSSTGKQEQEYRKIRENAMRFVKFIYPNMEGTVYDFKINDKKVQEKVGFICKNNPNSFGFHLNKSHGRTHNCSYKVGDNDFYWLNCKNSSKFYIIPEQILVEKGFIGDITCKQHLYISPTNKNTEWTKDYLFDYHDLDKKRFLNLLEII
jgi:hypothetical protein